MLRKFGLWKNANVQMTAFQNPPSKTATPSENTVTVREESGGVAVVTSTSGNPPTHGGSNNNGKSAHAPPEQIMNQSELSQQNEPKGFIKRFLSQLLRPKFCYIRDLYPLMFFLDVGCFIIVAFNYTSFSEGGSGNVISYIKVEN